MHRIQRRQGLAIILDLPAEEAAQAHEQLGRLGHRVHALQQQETAALRMQARQRRRVALGGPDHGVRAWRAVEPHATAEIGARQRSIEADAAAHAVPLRRVLPAPRAYAADLPAVNAARRRASRRLRDLALQIFRAAVAL